MEKTVRQVLRDTQLGAEKTRDAKKERKAKRRGQKPAHTQTGEPNEREQVRMKPMLVAQEVNQNRLLLVRL